MDILDVKTIIDIPGIEDYLSKKFTLDCYDAEDNIQCYTLEITKRTSITLELITDEPLIAGKQELAEILTQDPIYYASWSLCIETGEIPEVETMYIYRPLVDNYKKNFYKPKK